MIEMLIEAVENSGAYVVVFMLLLGFFGTAILAVMCFCFAVRAVWRWLTRQTWHSVIVSTERKALRRFVFFLFMASISGGCNRMVGCGEKVGTIIKLSEEGFFFKTWEGEMVRGGMNGGSGAFSTKPLHFTVNNPDLLPQVQKAFDSQKEVVVTFEGHLNVLFSTVSECTDDSGGGNCKFLTSIHER